MLTTWNLQIQYGIQQEIGQIQGLAFYWYLDNKKHFFEIVVVSEGILKFFSPLLLFLCIAIKGHCRQSVCPSVCPSVHPSICPSVEYRIRPVLRRKDIFMEIKKKKENEPTQWAIENANTWLTNRPIDWHSGL